MKDKYLILILKLIKKTEEGRLVWHKTDNTDEYQSSAGVYVFIVRSTREGLKNRLYGLYFKNSEMESSIVVSQKDGTDYNIIRQLYFSAKESSPETAIYFKKIMEELDRL